MNAKNEAKVGSTLQTRPTVSVPEDLHALINAVLASEHCCDIEMIELRQEFRDVRRDLRSKMKNLDETHSNITRIMEEQQRGSVAMRHLATSNATLHNQLLLIRTNLKVLAVLD
jgi:hypothetical protein